MSHSPGAPANNAITNESVLRYLFEIMNSISAVKANVGYDCVR